MGELRHDAIREAIREEALAMGFDAVGFAEARLAEAARADLGEFLARGYHGDMGWLAETAERRGDPQALWPEARTIVVLGLNYAGDDDPLAAAADPERGAISVYARGHDYHDTLKKRLKALARWIAARWPAELKVFVDTAPVMEKRLARQAHQPGLARIRLLAVSRRNLSEPGAHPGCAGKRPLRPLPALPRRLSDQCLPGALPPRRKALHLVSDDRAQGADPA